MVRDFLSGFGLFAFLMLLTGFGYPMVTLYGAQILFPKQANGSLIETRNGVIGSELIGQNFSGEAYFHPRPSAAGQGYDAANSSGSNSGPTDPAFLKTVSDRAAALKKSENLATVPVDLVTASGSGLDPHISPAAARVQIPRVAAARHMDAVKMESLVTQYTEPRTLGFLGASRVNVLLLNRALDQTTSAAP